MLGQVLLVYAGVLVTITVLFHLKGFSSFIANYLSTFVAVLLIYTPVLHVRRCHLPVVFFERSVSEVLRSLRLFLITALVIFPPFLLLAHFYQTLFFGMHFDARGFHWSWQAVAIQLILVALPEEFFFRGYLQTMLATRFSKRFRLFGAQLLEVPVAVPLASLIFALSHSIITLRWWHFAIFFPSLVFGWLRERTNGLVAPILFHALSNLILNQIGYFYR
jgi:membrane protease YdiL (CAAX protease family)